MIETEKYGTYHVSNTGEYISWYNFAKEIFKQANMKVKVVPVGSDQYEAKANVQQTLEWIFQQ
ncbi:sugar nucleotide-binding protein [Allobaculum stercoricanis]|uniref:sugar nucleotide-binding protein n=1 Tax=Allobaculum stercoricanis TaxID=174709 RepID=UPI0003A05A8F|nr:sugar nucleotide-binding protein [Allobaculum stercoricanis]